MACSKSSSKVVALIGADGFLGRSLVSALLSVGHLVHKYDVMPRNADTSYVDVTDLDSLRTIVACDVMIVLAAEHRDDVRPVSRYFDVNVGGAENICAVATELGVENIVFTSSVAIYGFAPQDTCEDGDVNYFNEYGRTKYLAENVYKDWFSQQKDCRCLTIVRPTVIFGPGNRGNVYNLIKQIAARKFVMFGDGENVKSMAYVENVASFLCHTLTFEKGSYVFNYVDKPDLTMNNLVGCIETTLFGSSGKGWKLPARLGIFLGYVFDGMAFITGRQLPVSSIRIKKFMATTKFGSREDNGGFVAPFSLEIALQKTIRHEFPSAVAEQHTHSNGRV